MSALTDFMRQCHEPQVEALQTRIAALEAQLAERVKVKQLEWQGDEGGPGKDCFSEPTPYLAYRVRHLSDGRFDVILDTDTGSIWFGARGEIHATYAEAKAAAQADFDRRILSALEATPPAPKVTVYHPMQPVVVDESGIHRFKSNKCVEALLEHGQKTGFGLNELTLHGHTPEDQMQLAQLIGYSVSGYGDLSYVTDASYDLAAEQSQALTAAQEAGR